MQAKLVTIMLLMGVWTIPAAADGTTRCVLEVDGQSYIDGPCEYSPSDSGDFQISAKDYFAYIYPSYKPVLGYWNGTPGTTHAHDPLGELTKNGACWVNDRAKVCAYE